MVFINSYEKRKQKSKSNHIYKILWEKPFLVQLILQNVIPMCIPKAGEYSLTSNKRARSTRRRINHCGTKIWNNLPFYIKSSENVFGMTTRVFLLFAQNELFLVLFFYYEFYNILRRYLISYKLFVVLTEKDLFC